MVIDELCAHAKLTQATNHATTPFVMKAKKHTDRDTPCNRIRCVADGQ